MKKVSAFLLSAAMLLCLCACGSNAPAASTPANTPENESGETIPNTPEASESPAPSEELGPYTLHFPEQVLLDEENVKYTVCEQDLVITPFTDYESLEMFTIKVVAENNRAEPMQFIVRAVLINDFTFTGTIDFNGVEPGEAKERNLLICDQEELEIYGIDVIDTVSIVMDVSVKGEDDYPVPPREFPIQFTAKNAPQQRVPSAKRILFEDENIKVWTGESGLQNMAVFVENKSDKVMYYDVQTTYMTGGETESCGYIGTMIMPGCTDSAYDVTPADVEVIVRYALYETGLDYVINSRLAGVLLNQFANGDVVWTPGSWDIIDYGTTENILPE